MATKLMVLCFMLPLLGRHEYQHGRLRRSSAANAKHLTSNIEQLRLNTHFSTAEMSLLRCDWNLKFQRCEAKEKNRKKQTNNIASFLKGNEYEIVCHCPVKLICQLSFQIESQQDKFNSGSYQIFPPGSSGVNSAAKQQLFFLSFLRLFSLNFNYFWLEELVSLASIVGIETSTRNKTQNRIVDWWNDIKLLSW